MGRSKKGALGEPSDERRAVVLLEEMKPQLQLVLEGQTGLTQRLDRLEKRVDENYNELHKFMMAGFKEVYKELDRRFAQVDEQFTKVDERFVEVNSRLDALTNRFDTHEQAHAN